MIGLPTIHLEGTLVGDPELRFTPKGQPVTKFRVACNGRRYDKGAGKWVDASTTYLSTSCWRELAENVAETLRKGDRVIVIGSLTQREWEGKDGKINYAYDIDAEHVGPSLAKVVADLTLIDNSPTGNATTDSGDDPWATK